MQTLSKKQLENLSIPDLYTLRETVSEYKHLIANTIILKQQRQKLAVTSEPQTL